MDLGMCIHRAISGLFAAMSSELTSSSSYAHSRQLWSWRMGSGDTAAILKVQKDRDENANTVQKHYN